MANSQQEKDIVSVSINDIELDPENPRLPLSVRDDKQANSILAYLADETALHELMQAIGANGFFPGEPVVVIPGKSKKYRVVEGNRRIAALMLLSNPELLERRPRVAAAADEASYRPTEVPVVVFQARDEVMAYLGYRHITGVKQWDPLSKARYMAQIFEHKTDKSRSPGDRYKHAAKFIGSRTSFVKRTLTALALYDIIEDEDFFEIRGLNDRTVAFSLLSTATGYENIATYVGAEGDPIADRGPIKIDKLKNLTRWLFEKVGDSTRLGESRDLGKLAAVLGTPSALEEFEKKGATLEHAWRLTRAVEEEFDKHLNSAIEVLTTAASLLPGVTTSAPLKAKADELFKYVRHIKRTLEQED